MKHYYKVKIYINRVITQTIITCTPLIIYNKDLESTIKHKQKKKVA